MCSLGFLVSIIEEWVMSVRVQELGVEISQLLVSSLVHEMCLEYARRLVDV